MRWLALTITADMEAVEAVSEIFGRLGRGSAVEPVSLVPDPRDEEALRADPAAGYRLTVHVPDDASAASAIETTRRALWHLQAFGLRPLGELEVTPLDDVNWLTAWRSEYTSQRIGRLRIVPTWLDAPTDGGPYLRLDPGMAFGTGLHPTTRACLLAIQSLDSMPGSVLDVGCGSGILALGALRLGCMRAIGYDTDALAVAAAWANAQANGLAERFEVRHGSLPLAAEERFPLVVANLVATVLVDLAPRLAAHLSPAGTLIASGILESRAPEVEAALAAEGLATGRQVHDDDWVTLQLRKPG